MPEHDSLTVDDALRLVAEEGDVEEFCNATCWAIHSGLGVVPGDRRFNMIVQAIGGTSETVTRFLVGRGLIAVVGEELVLPQKGVGLAVRYGLETMHGPKEDADDD